MSRRLPQVLIETITVTAFQQQARERKVFVGDCLFAGSIGRTDLPGGSDAELMDSLSNKIIPPGDDVTEKVTSDK
ncbi:MAG: hydroxyacylglutathione hydrolase [Pyrinomonadaceae bacterium]|nr:hydroxyacylglutathione hydrolase [Pyrinomonadaceae bacterium]